ncbi:MAG: hypothetical protein ACK5OS_15125, partial [Chryseotalea sp.]
FIILYFLIDKDISSELKKVMAIDIVATVILLIGLVLFLITSKNIKQCTDLQGPHNELLTSVWQG